MPYFGVPIRNGLPIGLGSQAGFGIAPFDPRDLFSAGEQGAWYDPSDLTTLFTDSAGTTPVTAVEQFVGLMLDKSKGLVLGATVVTNGDFSQGSTGWTLGGSATVSAGQLIFADGVYSQAVQSPTGYANKWYLFQFDLTITSGSLFFRPNSASVTDQQTFTTSGTKSFYARPTAAGFEIWTTAGVGIRIDNVVIRELPGNHAFQTTSAKRPKLAARYNLLTYTEQFDHAIWTKVSCTIASNSTAAPDGTTTADTLTASAGPTLSPNVQQVPASTAAGATTFSLYVKAGTYGFVQLINNGDGEAYANFNVSTGVTGTAGTKTTASITAVGNGWYRCSVAFAATTTYGNSFRCYLVPSNTATYAQVGTFAGTETVFIWGADLRPASQATGLIGPTYQRVVDAATYDTAGFLPYLEFNGLTWSMSTNNIVPGTDKVQVFAGTRKQADPVSGAILLELSPDRNSNNGAFTLVAPAGNSPQSLYGFVSKGTNSASALPVAGTFPAPITNVLTGIGDISGDLVTLNVNGIQAETSSADQGTGNYLTYPLFIGARNNASLFFNGWLSSLIVRFGPNLSTSTIQATESWVAGKTGVSL